MQYAELLGNSGPKNASVHLLNTQVLNIIEGDDRVYRLMDTVHEDDDIDQVHK